MPYARHYSKKEVEQMLAASEGAASPVSGEPGHALAKHVNLSSFQITDRLIGTFVQMPNRPIALPPPGQSPDLVTPKLQQDLWMERHGITRKQAKRDYRIRMGRFVKSSGAFMNRNQAIIVAKFMLNSQEGQAELAKFDAGTENRVAIDMSTRKLDMVQAEAYKMLYAERGGGGVRSVEFGAAFMLLDKAPENRVHVQTLYPKLGL